MEKQRESLLPKEASKIVLCIIKIILKGLMMASLVAQWKRICLPMKEMWVPSLVLKDPTCCGATKPSSTTAERVL